MSVLTLIIGWSQFVRKNGKTGHLDLGTILETGKTGKQYHGDDLAKWTKWVFSLPQGRDLWEICFFFDKIKKKYKNQKWGFISLVVQIGHSIFPSDNSQDKEVVTVGMV